ncbi:MAG TPA: ABC transporter permease [Planctomycetota bacterium]|nr:ABC transporter permease [Planctomycetota bacterium]
MTTYIIKRLLLMPLMLLGITIITFVVISLAPGTSGATGTGEMSVGRKMTKQQQEVLRNTFHIGRPIHERYLLWLGVMQPEVTVEQQLELLKNDFMPDEPQDKRVEAWTKLPDEEKKRLAAEGPRPPKRGLIFGDFGRSVATPTMTVWQKIMEALPVTIVISILVYIILYLISIPMGIYSATHHTSKTEKVTTVGLFVLYSLPSFWVAVLLMKGMVMLNQAGYPSLPIQGLFPAGAEQMPTLQLLWETTQRLFLPVVASSYAGIASLSRFMRVGMLDIISSDFVRTARAKGCPQNVVIYKHALRNSLIPMVTIIAGMLPGLVGGSVIIESIFGINGMGLLAYTAVLTRDYTLLMAEFTLVAVLVLIGILVSDILYVIVDPRISLDKGAN